MSSFDFFRGSSWDEWAEHQDKKYERKIDRKSEDAKNNLLKETPKLPVDVDIAQSQSGPGSLLGKCAVCHKVVKLCALRRHVSSAHPESRDLPHEPPTRHSHLFKTEPVSHLQQTQIYNYLPQYGQSLTQPTRNPAHQQINSHLPAKPDVKTEPSYNPNNNFQAKVSKSKKRAIAAYQVAPKRKMKSEENVRRDPRATERSIFFNRSQPVVIYGEISSDESDCEEVKKFNPEGVKLTYINRLVQPMAYPRYGCLSDVTKGSKVIPFSSAARQLNQQLSLINPSGPVLTGLEGSEFEGSSPMTPLSQPSPKLKPVLSQMRV